MSGVYLKSNSHEQEYATILNVFIFKFFSSNPSPSLTAPLQSGVMRVSDAAESVSGQSRLTREAGAQGLLMPGS